MGSWLPSHSTPGPRGFFQAYRERASILRKLVSQPFWFSSAKYFWNSIHDLQRCWKHPSVRKGLLFRGPGSRSPGWSNLFFDMWWRGQYGVTRLHTLVRLGLMRETQTVPQRIFKSHPDFLLPNFQVQNKTKLMSLTMLRNNLLAIH